MKQVVDVKIPIKTIGQDSSHWAKIRTRNKMHKVAVWYALIYHIEKVTLPCKIILTRISPREMDEDNLLHSFKSIRDEVSNMIIPGLAPGRADGNKNLTFEYSQGKGDTKEYAVNIQIYC